MPTLIANAPGTVPETSAGKAAFLLVHGAFHGAWCWKHVSDRLRRLGHQVLTPTLTGLGERAHLAHPAIDLDTHIGDVTQAIECEEWSEVILVGHSYGGYVAAGVADRMQPRIRRLVYLDAFLPRAGTDFFSHIPPPQVQEILGNLIDGYLVPAFPPEMFGVLPVGSAPWRWVMRRLTPQPVATFQTSLVLGNAIDRVDKTYVRCATGLEPEADAVYRAVRDCARWRYRQLATAHDAMVMAPEALAILLAEESQA